MLCCRNAWEKIFFYRNFLTKPNSRKNKFQIFHFFSIRIERPVEHWYSKKFYWPLLHCRNSREKNFFLFSLNISINHNSRKNQIQLFDFLLVRFERPVNTDAKKVLMTFVVLSKSAWKNIFFSQNFLDQWEFEKKQIQLYDFFLIGIERPMNTDAKEILLTFVVLSKFARKNFFFKQNFSTNQNSRKMKFIYLIFFSFRSRDQWTLMLKKFYWPLLYCRNSREKIFFFKQNFSTNQNSRKMKFIYLIFFSFRSRDQWTLMLKKFYWPLLYCRNSGEKIFFFPQNFSTNQNSRKNRIQLFDFLLIGIERPMTTDAKKVLMTFVVLSKFGRKNFFFSTKFFDQSKFEKISNSIIRFFTHWNRETNEHWC